MAGRIAAAEQRDLREIVVTSGTSRGQILPSAGQVRFAWTEAKNIEGSETGL